MFCQFIQGTPNYFLTTFNAKLIQRIGSFEVKKVDTTDKGLSTQISLI